MFEKKVFHCIKVIIIIFLLLDVVVSCKHQYTNSNYHVKIQYTPDVNNNSIDLRNGIVALTFVSYFKEDTLSLEVNNKKKFEEVLTTNEVTGSALTLKVDTLKNVKRIGIRINRGQKAIIKCNEENQLFLIHFQNDTLLIKGVTFFPPKL